MTGPDRPGSWAEALAAVDEVLAELTALRRQVAELRADRDTWRGKASYP
jgi:hypothetical protein